MHPILYLDMIIGFGILAVCLVIGYDRDKGLNRRRKTDHAFFLGCIIFLHSRAFHVLIWAPVYPNLILEYHHIRIEFFPAWLSLLDLLLEVIVRLAALCFAYGLALRKQRALTLFVRFIPLFFLIDFWCVLKEDMRSHLSSQVDLSLASFSYDAIWSLLLVTFVYVGLYFFFVSEKTRCLIFGLETSGNKTSGTGRYWESDRQTTD